MKLTWRTNFSHFIRQWKAKINWKEEKTSLDQTYRHIPHLCAYSFAPISLSSFSVYSCFQLSDKVEKFCSSGKFHKNNLSSGVDYEHLILSYCYYFRPQKWRFVDHFNLMAVQTMYVNNEKISNQMRDFNFICFFSYLECVHFCSKQEYSSWRWNSTLIYLSLNQSLASDSMLKVSQIYDLVHTFIQTSVLFIK